MQMRALSIRQPYAELILRGEKTIEYRSRPTRLIGERFYIYAAKKPGLGLEACGLGQTDLDRSPQVSSHESQAFLALPTGVIVGSATISRCERAPHNGHPAVYCWHLSNVKRFKKPRKPKGQPQPVWFRPF